MAFDLSNEAVPGVGAASPSLSSDEDATDSEFDSNFGDGIEPEHVLDPGRAILDSMEAEDDHGPDMPTSSLLTFASNHSQLDTALAASHAIPQRPYSSIVRRFMVLVTAICVYFGLGREPAGLLLSFFSIAVEPLLDPADPPIPRQLDTVRRYLGILPVLCYYAVCPSCERLERRTDGIGNCPSCHTQLYERPGKPKMIFAYQSLVEWLTWLLSQPGVEVAMAEWRDRDPNVRLRDVWDGLAWRSELDPQRRAFTDHSLSLLVALDIVWFSLFRSQYTSWHSTGAILMCILNLPPRLRYLFSSTYIAGCTPGPKEPKATAIGGYLRPMLEEHELLNEGMSICTHEAPNGRLVRLRVAFYSGDTVGRNKVCGFPSHSVRKGEFCGFCSVDFESKVAAFEHALPLRDDHQHRLDAERYQRPFASKADKDLHERNTGARYSPLLQLSYWRSVSRSPVDYMHCLELGLAKRLFHRVLIVGEVITPAHLAIIQRGLQTCRVPSSEQAPDQRLGDPGGGSATAAHWSTLMRRLLPLLLFVAWRDIIVADDKLDYVIKPVDTSARPDSDATHNTPEPATLLLLPSRSRVKKPRKRLRIARPVNARDMVRNVAQLAAATTLAARRSMSLPDVDQLDAILRDYGRTTAVLFGAAAIIYNLHLALHLPEHIRRFGPAYHFSAYHFERMNGQLGRTPTNRHRNGKIETTYTTAFVTSGRFEYQLAREEVELPKSIADRAPPIRRRRANHLTAQSLLSGRGIVEVSLSSSEAFTPSSAVYQQLYEHLRSSFSHLSVPLHPIWIDQPRGVKVMKRMKEHAQMTFGHLNFGGAGVRKNASVSRTLAVVDAVDGGLDLFEIQTILSHELQLLGETHTSVFLLGRRAVREPMPAFDTLFSPSYGNVLRMFWTITNDWRTIELLPAHALSSDAAIVFMDHLSGVSPGEDQRHAC